MQPKVYFDHSATTPVRPEVREIMHKFMADCFGNPSSQHGFGGEARQGLNWAREQIAAAIGASPAEIYFTSGGTEADNLAILGMAWANAPQGKHIITSSIEHHAVIDACKFLETKGFRVTYLPVDRTGVVSLAALDQAIDADTILISIMQANNEIGTLQPIKEISERAQAYGIPLHTDGVQAFGKLPVNVDRLGVSLFSASAHKIYGPKGIGFLYVRNGTPIAPLWYGGNQENKLRPGTENLPGIVGFGKAIELALAERETVNERLHKLRTRCLKGLKKEIPEIKFNGHPLERVPGHLNLSFMRVSGPELLTLLSSRGVAASGGSACMADACEASHVLKAIGLTPEEAQGALRFSLGRDNTETEIDYLLGILPELVADLRSKGVEDHDDSGHCFKRWGG